MNYQRPLRRVRDLPAEALATLQRKQLTTCQDVLNRSLLDMIEMGLPLDMARHVQLTVARAICPKHTTAKQLAADRSSFLATRLPTLDSLLAGGIPSATITELAGPAGSGKTQFCTMLAMLGATDASVSGTNGGVIYIDTEGAFSSERLVNMAQNWQPDYYGHEANLVALCQRVHVIVTDTSAALLSALESLEDVLISQAARLLIVDSAASPLRKEFQGHNTHRADILNREATLLKYYAETFNLQVVVTNQVTTRFDDDSGGDTFVTAALGNTWAHSVNTRLTLNYTANGRDRFVRIVKSPLVAAGCCGYRIASSGLVEVPLPAAVQAEDALPSATNTRIQARDTAGQAFADAGAQYLTVLQAQRTFRV